MFIHQEKTRYCASWIYTFGAQHVGSRTTKDRLFRTTNRRFGVTAFHNARLKSVTEGWAPQPAG